MVTAMRTKMLLNCGNTLPKVTMILYSPFHDFIRRSIRTTRSIRRIRRNDRFVPVSAKSAVIVISAIDMITMVPSSWFQPSIQ